MKLGDRVKTHKFGEGTVVGFEDLDIRRDKCLVVSTPPHAHCRVVVALDNPKAWIAPSANNPHPYMMYGDFDGVDFLPPMAVARTPKVLIPPEFKPLPKPMPLPDIERKPARLTYIVRAFIVLYFLMLALVYLR